MINGSFATVIRKIVIDINETMRFSNIMTFDNQTSAMVVHQFSCETKIKELIFQSCLQYNYQVDKFLR
jgi:hypothetical protein